MSDVNSLREQIVEAAKSSPIPALAMRQVIERLAYEMASLPDARHELRRAVDWCLSMERSVVDEARAAALEELTAQAQELGMGY
jgi:hypothetical protein